MEKFSIYIHILSACVSVYSDGGEVHEYKGPKLSDYCHCHWNSSFGLHNWFLCTISDGAQVVSGGN